MKPKIISVVGPTAVGKTNVGIEICKRFDGEVINGDAIQIYRQFDIGSAKASLEEQAGIPHHLIDYLDPTENYSASDFQMDVKQKALEIESRGKVPVLVGGTGFYVQSALYDFNFPEVKRDEAYSKKLLSDIEREGIEPYYERLKEVDSEQAERIHPNNIRRVIRALEVYESTGKPMSVYEKEQSAESSYRPWLIGLTMERSLLYERINLRVDHMIEQGLINEAKQLYDRYGPDVQPMQGIGYKEWIPYFKDEYDREEAIERVKRNTRRFAKRQLTYFRNKFHEIQWYEVDLDQPEKFFSSIFSDLEGFLLNGENS